MGAPEQLVERETRQAQRFRAEEKVGLITRSVQGGCTIRQQPMLARVERNLARSRKQGARGIDQIAYERFEPLTGSCRQTMTGTVLCFT